MVTVLSAGGPWNQLASAAFFLSALVSDVLVLRLFLFAAYVFLFSGAVTGYPKWPHWGWQDAISVDGIVWSSMILIIHGYAIWRHLWDERPIKFKTEDDEQLWRLFYRRSGMYRLEMSECLRFGRWARYRAGDIIVTPTTSHTRLHLLVEGLVEMETESADDGKVGGVVVRSIMRSGTMFDFGVANIFGVYIGFECGLNVGFSARAATDCLLYEWTIEDLEVMTSRLSPSVSAFWRSFVLCVVGLEYAARVHPARGTRAADGGLEDEAYAGGGRSRDFYEPLRAEELPPRLGFWGSMRAALSFFDPLPPAGLRHCSNPMSGVTARNRLVALTATKDIARRAESSALMLPLVDKPVEAQEAASATSDLEAAMLSSQP